MLQRILHRHAPPRQGGFTIVEVLIVLVILAVMVGLALPAMRELVTTQRVKGTSYDLYTDLAYARAEAISRGVDVVVASTSGTNDWRPGWTITFTVDGVTTELRSAPERSTEVVFTGPGPTVTFDRTGRATAAATVQFSIVPVDLEATDIQKRCLRLDPSGRARTANGACT